MTNDQDYAETNDGPIEDGLAALRRLSALDRAAADVSGQDRSSEADDSIETIPDWLELLLAKYGEQASMLVGIESEHLAGRPPKDLVDSRLTSKEASEVASLLEQMAAEAEKRPSPEQLATSVDWGKPARREDEAIEDETLGWLNQIAKPSPPPSAASAPEEETPDWLSEISQLTPEGETPIERSEDTGYSADAEEVPDWLQELPPAPQPPAIPERAKPSPPESAPSAGEIPHWMEELDATVPGTEPSKEEAAGEIPDWLVQLAGGAVSKAEERGEPPVELEKPGIPEAKPEAEVPDWLRELGAPEEAPAAGLPPAEPPAELAVQAAAEPEAEVPDWLRELGAPEEAPAVELAPAELAVELPAEPEAEVVDWLRELEALEEAPPVEPAPAELAVEAPAEPEAEVPDWLRELEAPEEAPAVKPAPAEPPAELAVEAPAEPEAEVPDWLRELEAPEEAPAVEPPPAELPAERAAEVSAEPEAEVPDWLASLRAEEPLSLEMAAEEEVSPAEYLWGEEAEEPDWLAELRTTSKPDVLALDEEVVEAEEGALPDWLEELRSSQAAAEMPPPGPEVLEEIPEGIEAEEETMFIQFLPAEVEEEPLEVEEAEPKPLEVEYLGDEEEDALAWLAKIEAAAAPDYTQEEALPSEAEVPPVSGAIPDWLGEMPPADLAEEMEIPEFEEAGVETRPAPDWLLGLGEEEGQVPTPAEEALAEQVPPAVEEGIVPAELPDWLLRFKPEEIEPTEARREEADKEAIESEGVLAGIPGLLPVVEEEREVEEEPIAKLRSRLGIPAVPDVEGAKLFKEIAAERPAESLAEAGVEPEPEPKSRRGRIMETLAWALVFIALIVAIALALMAVLDRAGDLLGGPAFREFFGSPLVIDPAPVNTFRAEVTKLPPDAVVVVSFDYSPATEAEMGPLAQIILGDLLESQARVIGVSLRPEGAAMAQRLFERFESTYPYGQRTINLGFLPGQTAGVRSLVFLSSAPLFPNGAQTLKDYPAWQDVDSLDDVALIVAVADSPLPIRWWVEQVGPGTLADRPMAAAVSTATDPTVRPYYNHIDPKSGQLLGLLSGVRDAAAYENRLRQPGRAVKSLAAQSVAHLGLVILSLVGTVAGFRTQATKE